MVVLLLLFKNPKVGAPSSILIRSKLKHQIQLNSIYTKSYDSVFSVNLLQLFSHILCSVRTPIINDNNFVIDFAAKFEHFFTNKTYIFISMNDLILSHWKVK